MRIDGFDVARALAVFGMVAVNFKLLLGVDDNGGVVAQMLEHLQGKAAALFVVLAGVGVSLLVRRAVDVGGVRRRLLKRAFALFIAGGAYSPVYPPDILHFYGVYLAAATLVLSASRTTLLSSVVVVTFSFVGLALVFDYERGWDWQSLSSDGMWTWPGVARHLLFNGFHPALPWLAFVFVGLLLGRIDWRRRKRRAVGGVALAVALATATFARHLASSAPPDGVPVDDWLALVSTSPMPPMPLFVLLASSSAIVVIVISVELAERCGDNVVTHSLVVTGQLSLTWYVLHVVLGAPVLLLLPQNNAVVSVVATAAFCILATLASVAWRRRWQRGPLETALRKLADALPG